jgi:PAS domain S-box-containing protein
MNDQATILAVDDTAESLDLLVGILSPAGYRVLPADSGELALTAVAANPPDLILLDVRMKGLDGLEVCRRLKARKETRGIPVILISAFADVKEWVAGLKLGAADYITKPFQPEELLTRVRAQLALHRMNVSLGQQETALHQTNEKLQAEIARRQRVEDELRGSLELAERSRRAMLCALEDQRLAEVERERLRAAIEQAGEIVIITDPRGVIQYANPAFETVTGYSRGEALGRSAGFLKSGEHDGEFYQRLWQTIGSGRSWQGTLVNRRKDGTPYFEDATISPVSEPGGRIVSYVAVKRDVTAQRQMEEQLRQAQKVESVGQLAGGVAHVFNNMLQVIISYVELSLGKVDAGQPLHTYLLEVDRAARRAAVLTGQLLSFARRQMVSPKVLDLNDEVAGAHTMIKRKVGEEIDLAWMPGHDLWKVKMDPVQLEQILSNLADNARDAMGGAGRLTMRTEKATFDEAYCAAHADCVPGDYVLLTVSDDGCGMDAETMVHLFEPFFTTKGQGKGTGLGLATVYGIVKQNNGHIEANSTPGKGTTFSVYLPRACEVPDAPPQGPQSGS